MIWRLFSRPDREPQTAARVDEGLLTHAAFKAQAFAVADRMLGSAGLERVRDYVWAAPGAMDVRPVFKLRLLKGAAVVPRWGVSLGCVPHLSGDKALWHRTQKSARADLYETHSERAMEMSLFGAEDRVARRVEAALARALPRAQAFWAVEDLAMLLARAEAGRGIDFDFGAPVNATRDITRAFVAARLGDATQARAALDEAMHLNAAQRQALATRLEEVLRG